MEPLHKDEILYNDFLGRTFASGREVEHIIAHGKGKEFVRVLETAKRKGRPSGMIEGFVAQLRAAKRIDLDEEGWISASRVFGSARDEEIFFLVLEAKPESIAITQQGALYFSKAIAFDVFETENGKLHRIIGEQKFLVYILLALLLFVLFRNVF